MVTDMNATNGMKLRGTQMTICEGCKLKRLCKELEHMGFPKGCPKTRHEQEGKMKHELKILPHYFQAVWYDKKNFEVRKHDRDFRVGDTLILREWENGQYTGSAVCKNISYILTADEFEGIAPGYCVLGIKPCGYAPTIIEAEEGE